MEHGTPTTGPRGSRGGLLASVVAVVVSLTSLGLAISGNRTQERMLAASVWPHIDYGSGNLNAAGEAEVRFLLSNEGVGPARLKALQVLYRDEPVALPAELLARCCGGTEGSLVWISSSASPRVLTAGSSIELLRVPRAGNPPAVWAALNRERHAVRVVGCYCSVLDDCWRIDSALPQPTPVAACPAPAPEPQWRG